MSLIQPSGHTGLTPRETAIMDLWDAGHGSRSIARRLGQPLRRVARILHTYAGDEAAASNKAMVRGSTALLAALKAAA